MPVPSTAADTPVTSEKELIWLAMSVSEADWPKENSRRPLAPAISTVSFSSAAARPRPAAPRERNTPACWADWVTMASTSTLSLPSLAPLTCRSTMLAFWPETVKSNEPLSSLVPWKVVVWLMRSMVERMLSICCWLASFSSVERPASEPDWPMRDCSSSRRELTSWSPPSATLTTCSARSALPMAVWSEAFSLRSASEAMRPAGSSPPRLMRKPVLSRSSVLLSDWFCWDRFRWAMRD